MLVAQSSQREVRHLIDRLRAVGLDKYIELPQIAVMGDTSSGKSSVLSALSGITFPSSGNLTTRCPTQLVLTQAKTFSGTQLVDEGQEISDDAIEIKLHGPDFPDLTLTDLPGLIRTVGDSEDKTMIARVDKLVHRYLVQDRTIILAVVPANVDMHNTAIIQAAEEADPDGNRTISIITKPDLIDPGAEDAVVDLLMNKTKHRRLGYHIVKCRGQKALSNNVTIQEGRDDEAKFFDTHPVWSQVDPALCGTARLADKLTTLLMETVCKALPKVMDEIDGQLAECKTKLRVLGEPMSSPAVRRATFMKHVQTIVQRLEGGASGSYHDEFFEDAATNNRLRACLRKAESEFQDDIERLSVVGAAVMDTSSRVVAVGDVVEVSKDGAAWAVDQVTTTTSSPNAWLDKSQWRFRVELDLSELKEMLEANRGDELSIFLSYSTFANVVRQRYVAKWRQPMLKLFGAYQDLLHGFASRVVRSTQCKPTLDFYLNQVAKGILARLAAATTAELNKVMESESRPYTMNDELTKVLMQLRTQPLLDALDALTGNNDAACVPIGAVKALLKNHTGIGAECHKDQHAKELHLAIVAYTRVASKRFVDVIPMLLQTNLIKPFLAAVYKEASETSDNVLERVLMDNVADVERHHNLSNQLKSLDAAKSIINAY